MTVRARQHVWVRTPSVRMARFSDVKRRSEPAYNLDLYSESCGSQKGQARADVQGALQKAGQKVRYEGHGVRVRMNVCRLVVLTELRCVVSTFGNFQLFAT